MRLIWALAIACVIAATGVRPELEVRDDASAGQLHRATAPAPFVAIRGASVRTPDVRLPPFVIPPPPSVASRVRLRTYIVVAELGSATSARPSSQSARGPPVV